MASTSEIARRYFAALSARDLDAAVACWRPGGVDRLVGSRELLAPDGIRAYFAQIFAAFPDFELEIIDLTTGRGRTAVRWRARGTFAGPGHFQGFAPNNATVQFEGCDVVSTEHDLIVRNDAYLDTGDVARQLGVLPPAGSAAEARLTKLANAKTRMVSVVNGVETELIAEGVWIVRGGFPAKLMNVYLLEHGDGVTVFDAGIQAMGPALRATCARMGGAARVVLGHADCDHRGAAAALDAPIYCHAAERDAAESANPFRDYWDLRKFPPPVRAFYTRMSPVWDSGALEIAGTIAEGDQIAGFSVIELPGHAPGLIGLWRESDRLALVSDCFYTVDAKSGRKGPARIPHPAFNADIDATRAAIRKLAALEPSAAWAGHADPVTGDVAGQLQQAAAAPL